MPRVIYTRTMYSYLHSFHTDESIWRDSQAASLLRKAAQGNPDAMMRLSERLRDSRHGESEALRLAVANFWEGRSLFFRQKDWYPAWLARHEGQESFPSLTAPCLYNIHSVEGNVFHQLGLGENSLDRLTKYDLDPCRLYGTPFIIASYVAHEDRDEGGFGWETDIGYLCLDLNLNKIPGTGIVVCDSHDGPEEDERWEGYCRKAAAYVGQCGMRLPAGIG